jgi:hypothetical protein
MKRGEKSDLYDEQNWAHETQAGTITAHVHNVEGTE